MQKGRSYRKFFVIDGVNSTQCNACHEMKPVTDFGEDRRKPSGIQGICRKCNAKGQSERRTPEITRNNNLKHMYGITHQDYMIMYLRQGGKCAICHELSSKLVIDHCHIKGHIRALLCGNCNIGIGNLQDNPANLQQAYRYLQEFQHD